MTSWNVRDWVSVLVFVLIACKLQVACLYGDVPYVITNSDSAAVTSFLTGWLHGGEFTGDLILDDPTKYQPYITLVLPIVAFIHLFEPDIGRAFVYQMFPVVLLHCLGFYLLGRRLFVSRLASAALAVITLVPVWTIPGDLWGISDVPMVRMVYGAVFPYLLLLALRCQANPRLIYWLALACAGAFYLHAVSGPSVFAAMLCALLTFKPDSLTWPHWLVRLALATAVWVAAIIPFVAIYVSTFPMSSAQTDVNAVITGYGPYADVKTAFIELWNSAPRNPPGGWGWRWLIWGAGLAGLIAGAAGVRAFDAGRSAGAPATGRDGYLASRSASHSASRFLLTFLFAIAIFSFGVTYVDQTVNRAFDRGPIQIDLVRNIRFAVPVLLIGFAQFMIQLYRLLSARVDRRMATALIVFATAALGYRFAEPAFEKTIPGFWSLSLDGLPRAYHQLPAGLFPVMAKLAEAPEPRLVLPVAHPNVGLGVRYGARMPVAWVHKDQNALVYASHPDLGRWRHINSLMQRLHEAGSTEDSQRALCEVLLATRPDLLLVDASALAGPAFRTLESSGPMVLRSADTWLIEADLERCG